MKSLTRLPIFVRILLGLVVVGLIWWGYRYKTNASTSKSTYQTETVEKGNLIVATSATGTVSTSNSATVTTEASGVVTELFVQNGDTVKVGDKIAQIELDLDGRQRSSQAYASYQSAKNALDSANANLYSAQSTMLSEWQKYMDKAQNSTYEFDDNTPNNEKRTLTDFVTTQDNWLAAEAKYKLQQQAIIQAQTALSSTWYSYQKASPVIYAPISGTVTGLSLQKSEVITSQSNSSGGASAQKIASILTDAKPVITVNITQIDIPKIAIGNKATVTLDAFADKTFAGTVISIDSVGTSSSGVTTYPTVIALDTDVQGILPNMSAQANIITATKTDTLIVPSTAVQTANGQSTVQILKDGSAQTVSVLIGITSDTQTEILSGLSEGDMVITGTTSTSTQTTTTTTSPFSAFGNRSFGGGTQMRIAR